MPEALAKLVELRDAFGDVRVARQCAMDLITLAAAGELAEPKAEGGVRLVLVDSDKAVELLRQRRLAESGGSK